MLASPPDLRLSGERFQVIYQLSGDEAAARAKAADICLEQTVEFPDSLVPAGAIRDGIVGRVESVRRLTAERHEAAISFAVEIAGGELTGLLNVVFGNISLKPGIRVERLELPERALEIFRGPRFGIAGLRRMSDVPDRPLLCTALKPMGLSPEQLAELAYQFALGGIDLIKDDHGLTDQPFCPFEERVKRCAEAVHRANRETGRGCIYLPHVTARADQLVERALFAKQNGAGGLLVCPGLAGFDAMRQIADDDRIALPVMAHPALLGSFTAGGGNGIAHFTLYGQLMRLAGADASIFPNVGGRFAFSREECVSIAQGCAAPMGAIQPIFPTPGGGMSLDRLQDMRAIYGREAIFLIGGGLHQHGPDVVENCRYFAKMAQEM